MNISNEGIRSWRIYFAVKQQFQTNNRYDFFKYNGKLRFPTAPHNLFPFYKVEETVPIRMLPVFYAHLFLEHGTKIGFNTILEHDFLPFIKYNDSILRIFNNDLNVIVELLDRNQKEFKDLLLGETCLFDKIIENGLIDKLTYVILWYIFKLNEYEKNPCNEGWFGRVASFMPFWLDYTKSNKELYTNIKTIVKITLEK